jgi:hypothetical protein
MDAWPVGVPGQSGGRSDEEHVIPCRMKVLQFKVTEEHPRRGAGVLTTPGVPQQGTMPGWLSVRVRSETCLPQSGSRLPRVQLAEL